VINAALPPSFSTGASQLPEFLLAWPELDALVCVSDELACGCCMNASVGASKYLTIWPLSGLATAM
jgi:DNA-binding LacI/PurR family transcriptional regulator